MAEIPLVFLKISDAAITTIRIVNDSQNHIHGGYEYIAFPFKISFPSDMPDQLPACTITIDNVSQYLADEIRALSNPPDVEIFAALASDPSRIEAGPYEMKLRKVSRNAMVITGTLTELDHYRESYPGDNYSPTNTPGLYAEV